MKNLLTILLVTLLSVPSSLSYSQSVDKFPDTLSKEFHGLKFRNIGPYRGGRSNAVSGVIGDPMTYYMGTVGGGLYKTVDAGISWDNVTDGQLETSSVGAVAVSESDPNVIYLGMGEHAVRGVMTSHGDGVYKSTDAGATWHHLGLKETQHISRIRIHPSNPDVVYVAAQGALYGPNAERGIYKSVDGGATWSKILFVDDGTGAADLSMDMNNPRILYASMWDYQRYPWKVRSGGPGSGIYKSIDSGATWKKLTEGLPEKMGKVAVDVSRANSQVVYANIEADKSGVYRSNDGGKKWSRVSADRITITRSWYYIEIYADPQNEDVVYVMNAPFLQSIDGGKSFKTIRVPHGDQHDLWINPHNNQNMINANDGGGNVSFNGGRSWSAQDNQATAQFYRVITDNQFPYRIYGGQQDNSTVSIKSRTNGGGIGNKDWTRSAGGESAFLAFDENNPKRVFGGSYQGNMSMYDVETGVTKDVMAYPVIGLGTIAKDMKYRFNWNSPIVASPQDPTTMYHGGNHVMMTKDEGNTWVEISPDLTRDDTLKQGPGGEPYTNEGAGGENYNTITYMAVSPHEAGLIYVGTDDGLIHLTKDEGNSWNNITPPGTGELLINCLEVSPHSPSRVIAVLTRYKMNDKQPMIYISEDYGQSWVRRNNGIAGDSYARVVREDKKVEGLLYAGTEQGLYASNDMGRNWHAIQLNLPKSPINDLAIRDNDLVVATSGRAFWILDDLSSLQTFAGEPDKSKAFLITPKPSYKYGLNAASRPIPGIGQNPLPGVILDFYLPEKSDSNKITVQIIDQDGEVIRHYTSKKDKDEDVSEIKVKPGLNRMNWNLRKDNYPKVEGLRLLQGLGGHSVAPGNYHAKLVVGSDSSMVDIVVKPYPGIEASSSDFDAQYHFLNEIESTFSEVHQSVNRMNKVKKQLTLQKTFLKEKDEYTELVALNDSTTQAIDAWLENLIQPKQKTFQDIINFPNQLNAELLDLKGRVDGMFPVVTAGARKRLTDLKKEWLTYSEEFRAIIDGQLSAYNQLYHQSGVPAVLLSDE